MRHPVPNHPYLVEGPVRGNRSVVFLYSSMADFERKSAIDVHAGLEPVAGWLFDAGSRSGRLQSRFRDPLSGPPGRGSRGQSLAAAPRENFVAWATV